MKNLVIHILFNILFSTVTMADQIEVGGVSIKIPAPTGFTSITEKKAIFNVWKRESHPTASTVAGFMSNEDYADWTKTQGFDWGYQNALVNVDHGFHSLDANELLFNRFRNKTKKYYLGNFPKAFSGESEGMINPDLQTGQLALAEFDEVSDAFIISQIGKVDKAQYEIVLTSGLLVKNRVIETEIIGSYRGKKDIDRLKGVAKKWLEDITRVNK